MTPNRSEQVEERAPYHRPTLKVAGNVRELTQTNAPPPFAGSDGGTFPNNYAS